MGDDLRVRLEGRLEVLERATATLDALHARLRSGRWARALAETRQQLGEWVVNVQPLLNEAVEAARRVGAQEALARLSDSRRRLGQTMARRLANTDVVRAGVLEEQLQAWLRLSEHTGLPPRPGTALAEASVTVRPYGWVGILALAGSMLWLSRPIEAACLVACAGAAWVWVQQTTRYRLFADVLVVEPDAEPPVEVPLRSIRRSKAAPGVTLRGLVDVELPLAEGLDELCARIDALFSERDLLEKERQVLAPFEGAPGLWLDATLQPPRPAAVEVFRFVQATGASPLKQLPPLALPAVPGSVLVSDRGVLFVGQAAERALRRLLFDSAPVELLRQEQRPLTAFPAGLLLQRLDAVVRLPDVHWVGLTDQVDWASEGDHDAVTLAAGRLTVAVDAQARARLRSLWPSR